MRMQFANLNLYDRDASGAGGPPRPRESGHERGIQPRQHQHHHEDEQRHREPPSYSSDGTVDAYFQHSAGKRVNTDALLLAELRKSHPGLSVTVVSPGNFAAPVQLLQWASATGAASFKPIVDPKDPGSEPYTWKIYTPPAHRLDDGETGGAVAQLVKFGKFEYTWESHTFLLYVADGRDGLGSYPQIVNQYLVHAPSEAASAAADDMIRECGSWSSTLHGEIWVFDGGVWQKSAALWQSVQKSHWRDVILDDSTKKALQDDISRFFESRERYRSLGVPWKRGVIYHGPPGNGKTVSIKASMHALYARKPHPIPSLYVKTLTSFGGPEYSVKQIFAKAREQAPCLLIFEDLDSIVTDAVRSYFLNEVDGLAANEGVMMVGSTNHLDRLDPGLSKRPSRFDRKFFFPKPDRNERRMYAQYWRRKLAKTEGHLEFPDALADEIARITDGFSFAYLQEAFIATLLAIAAKEDRGYLVDSEDEGEGGGDDGGDGDGDGGDGFDDLILWREFKKQVKILRDEM